MNSIHYQQGIVERFIPIDLEDIINDLSNSTLLAETQRQLFLNFCSAYVALYYAQSHQSLRALKRAYQPFNPDRDTHRRNQLNSPDQLDTFKRDLFAVIEDANYEQLSPQVLNDALNKESPHGVTVSVDFDEFAAVSLFYRGSAVSTELHRDWKRLQFKKRPVDILIYRRLFVLLQPRNKQQWLEYLVKHKRMNSKQAEKKAAAALNALGLTDDNPVLYLKLFKNIPRADLEMLFPNTRIQMRLFDKLKLGIMGGGGAAGGIMATISKFSATIEPMAALMAIGGLIGVLWRQIAQIFSQRTKYSAVLTKNLYFYNLATNLSALTLLADTASAEECKEALLAYFFLLVGGETNRDMLDNSIEAFVFSQYALPMDFEIDDGLRKLQAAQLLQNNNDLLTAIPINDALTHLNKQWEALMSG